jgi:alpha-1,3-rhamnosyl/mannosyltransferase
MGMTTVMMPRGGNRCHKPIAYHILEQMRVVIDASPLLVRSAGVKNYLYYWIEHLRRLAPESIGIFPPLGDLGPLTHEASTVSRWRTVAGLGALAVANRTPLPVLDWASRGADTFHATNLIHRPPRRVRLTSTIHDMTSWLMPELHSSGTLRADEYAAGLLRRAHGLIAVSECTKNDAVRVLGLAPERITVIHSGVPDRFFDVPPAEVEAVRARYSLKRPFVFALGTIEPRKNIPTLIEAFELLPASLRGEAELVLAGPMGWADAATAQRVRNTRYLGYVPEADLAPLTAAAAVFAYPSLYEGFGFPLAQAMAAGVACVTSNVSSMPEIAGDAALLIDPRSVSELRNAIERLLLSPGLRSDLARRARERARRFTWDTAAQASLRFFEGVAGQ